VSGGDPILELERAGVRAIEVVERDLDEHRLGFGRSGGGVVCSCLHGTIKVAAELTTVEVVGQGRHREGGLGIGEEEEGEEERGKGAERDGWRGHCSRVETSALKLVSILAFKSRPAGLHTPSSPATRSATRHVDECGLMSRYGEYDQYGSGQYGSGQYGGSQRSTKW
jgi:hypothetical protein